MKKSTYLLAAALGWSLASVTTAVASKGDENDASAAAQGINAAAAVGEDFAPAEAAYVRVGHGWRITNTKGMTLYTFTRDQQPGKSACNGNCTQVWPPLLASEGAQAKGDWSLISREGGKDVFVHFSAIQDAGNGYRSLNEGDQVEFTIEDSPKGPQATNVTKLS